MTRISRSIIAFYFLICTIVGFSQNETRQWRFGHKAGLDFGTSPPSIVLSNAAHFGWHSTCMSNKNGNLLFYCNGDTVWNSLNAVMANGTGLIVSAANSDALISIKKPGSQDYYYIFGVSSNSTPGAAFLRYSIIDMSLAGGQGSVTVKGASITTVPSYGKLAATKHCNGIDYWVVSRQYNTNNFIAHLITPLGLSLFPVVSSVGSVTGGLINGAMKISPNGKKLAMAITTSPGGGFEVFDFDNSTGIVSNSLSLGTTYGNSTGCEFSQDGAKLYGINGNQFRQWNLCAGSNTAIIASQYSTTPSPSAPFQFMQLASDGKIYVSYGNQQALGVINNPNSAGAGCNFAQFQQSTAPRFCPTSIPYFDNSMFRPLAPGFSVSTSSSLSCQTASFTMPAINTLSNSSCSIAGWSLTSLSWNFGDPLSGSANTSTLANPSHFYTAPGTYTAQLVLNYSCGSASDTLKQPVTITNPCISVASTSITCANLGSATVTTIGGVGPFSFTWMPSGQTGSVATGLIPGPYTLYVYNAFINSSYTISTIFTPLIPLTGSIAASTTIACNAANTATGSVTNLIGGSGNQTYLWNNGSSTSTLSAPNNLGAGSWSVTVTDALTACQVYSVFTISQPPALTLNIAASSPSTCLGTSITFTANNSGGTPAYTYTWAGVGTGSTTTVTQSITGNYVYTVNGADANMCLSTKTVAVNFISNPTLTVSDVSICPLQTGTLSVSGAITYTWNASSSVGSTFTASPVGSMQYAVVGTALGCTAAATASIIVKSAPSPTISNNSPFCNGQTLLLSASGGAAYLWNGPLTFVSSFQNPTISFAAPNRSGVYNLTVTAANSCTAPASTTVLVNATPTISMVGGQVCLNSNLYLSASSFMGSTYFWSGPNSYTSALQNPTLSNVTFSVSGNYSLLVNSASSCTNVSSVGVTVNPLPTISISPTSSAICMGKSSTLTVSGGATYLWNTGSTAGVFVLSPTVTTSYTVLGTSALGCTSTAVSNISVNVLPSVSVVVNPSVYCAGKSATLTASGANSYTWSASTTLSGTTIYSSSIIVNPAFTTFYNVKGTSATTGCSNTAIAIVSVNPLPPILASTTKSIICTGTSASITASGANTYTWLPGNIISSLITPSPLVNTSYTVRGTLVATGCTNMAVRTISVNKTPTVTMVSNTPSICIGMSAVITPSGASTYTLFPGNLTGNSFTLSPSSTTQFSLSGTNSVNCVNLLPSNINITVHNLKAIQGVVTSTTGQNNGDVVLYAYKPVLGKWDSLNTSLVLLNNYNFPSVPSGSYVVKSLPFPTDLVETYGLSASSWKGATVINHGCIVNSVQNINIISFNNTIKSKATLSGKVTQGAGYSQPGSPGTGIPNITVKAGIHPGPIIYQTTKTNSLGQYTLANMAPNVIGQNYYILVDIPALDTNKTYHRIIITGFENFTNLDFVVDSQRIHPLNLKVGVKELSMLNTKIKVYPNPASEQISIELELNKTEEVSIELFDLSGRKVKTLIALSQQEKGKLTVLAKVEEIKEGVYLLKIRIGEEEGVLKVGIAR